MVSRTLKLTFNLLTVSLVIRVAFVSVTSFFGIKVCVFLENDKMDLHQIFILDLGENT